VVFQLGEIAKAAVDRDFLAHAHGGGGGGLLGQIQSVTGGGRQIVGLAQSLLGNTPEIKKGNLAASVVGGLGPRVKFVWAAGCPDISWTGRS